MNRILGTSLLLFVLFSPTQSRGQGKDRASAVAPFLDEQTLVVVRVDLSKVDVGELAKKAGELGKFAELAQIRQVSTTFIKGLIDADVREGYLVISLTDLPNRPPFLVIPATNEAASHAIIKALTPLPIGVEKIGSAVVGGDKGTIQRLRGLKPTEVAEFSKAFTALNDGMVQVVAILPQSLRRALDESMPRLPGELGGGSTKPVTRGFRWAALSADLAPKLAVRVTLQAADAEDAKALGKLIGEVFQSLAKNPEAKRAIPNLDRMLDLLKPKVNGDRLTLNLGEKQLTDSLVPLVLKVQENSARIQSMNNLKQLALCMHNYHDQHKSFPTHASYDKQGRPLLSWRVHVLPYLDQDALYKEFRLDEPWDSEHNKKLIARMPQVFRDPRSQAGAGKTVYLAPIGKDTMFPPGPKGIRIQDVPDGTSNTILLVQADDSQAVEWTRPADLTIDPKQLLRGITRPFLAAYADGSVHVLEQIVPATFWALVTRNGGEVIPPDQRP